MTQQRRKNVASTQPASGAVKLPAKKKPGDNQSALAAAKGRSADEGPDDEELPEGLDEDEDLDDEDLDDEEDLEDEDEDAEASDEDEDEDLEDEDDEDEELSQSVSDGYDADAGPLETGYASEEVTLAELVDTATLNEDSLSVDPEDLGRRALQGAAQQGDPSSGAVRVAFEDVPLSAEGTLREYEGAEADALQRPDDTEPTQVDLTQNAIRNGSLFDQAREGEETNLRRPLIKVNEVDETLEHNERAHRSGAKVPAPKLDGAARPRKR